jgi:hypothetical protein
LILFFRHTESSHTPGDICRGRHLEPVSRLRGERESRVGQATHAASSWGGLRRRAAQRRRVEAFGEANEKHVAKVAHEDDVLTKDQADTRISPMLGQHHGVISGHSESYDVTDRLVTVDRAYQRDLNVYEAWRRWITAYCFDRGVFLFLRHAFVSGVLFRCCHRQPTTMLTHNMCSRAGPNGGGKKNYRKEGKKNYRKEKKKTIVSCSTGGNWEKIGGHPGIEPGTSRMSAPSISTWEKAKGGP